MIKVKNFQSFKPQTSRHKLIFFHFLLLPFAFCLFNFCLFFLCVSQSFAQPPQEPPPQQYQDEPKDAAPPPLKILYKEEKEQLEAENEIKKRTKLAILLMEARLKKAEELDDQNDFNGMFTELGGFHALMDNTLNFLNRRDNGGGKVLNNYKRIELNLRTFINRLEVIRRELPPKYEFYVRGLIKLVREARTKAVEPMFDDSVVPDGGGK